MKGPSISVMLAGKPKPGAEEEHEEEAGDTSSGAEDAATAFADAVEAKDAKSIVRAFKALSTCCGHEDEAEDEAEEEES